MFFIDREHVLKVAEDGLYTAVGLGVLAFQQAQVQRRELCKALRPARDVVGDRMKLVEERLKAFKGDV